MPDMINAPAHYQGDGIECIEAIRASMSPMEFRAHCKATAMKYVWRAGKKWDDQEDVKKAMRYLEWWVESKELEDASGD